MKILTNTVLLLLAALFFAACGDKDTVEPGISANCWRAKEIKGHNSLWGDFTLSLEYINETVSLGIVCDSRQDTVATLTDGTVRMKVPALSAEEIDALEPGSEIPMEYRTIYRVERTTIRESVTYYKREELSFVFDREENYLFEYDDTLAARPKILKWRKVGSGTSADPMERMVYTYDGKQIRQGEHAFYDNNWKVTAVWTYPYDGDRLIGLSAVQTDGQSIWSKSFSYTDNRIEVTTTEGNDVRKTTYTMNADGYVTRIDDGGGNYMDIKYEVGQGNFSTFTPIAKRLNGEPYIK